MTESYEWGPDDRAWKVIRDVFALPVKDVPSYARSARAFAGANPLKWLLVALGALGYLVGVLVYWLFALFPAGSYVFLWILAMPFVIAVYAVKAGAALLRRGPRDVVTPATESASTPATTASEAGPPPRRSTPHPRTSPG